VNGSQSRYQVVWAEACLWFITLCPLLLLLDQFSHLRPLVRGAVFSSGLLLLILLPRQKQLHHPAAALMLGVVAVMFLELFHPNTQILAGAAASLLYLSIVSPIFWVTSQEISPRVLRRLFLFLWAFQSLSSSFGILQVAFPGRFQPAVSSVIADQGQDVLDSLSIVTATGESVLRPMGLSDTPGGSAVAGFYAVLFGMAFFVQAKSPWNKLLFLLSAGVGMTCIYLSQVRSMLVAAIVCVIVVELLLILRREFVKSVSILMAGLLIVFGGFSIAVWLGADSVTKRVTTLFEDSPQQVYGANRGGFLEETIELLPKYPLGDGLGRYGMMNAYFGHNQDPEKQPVWVEIMWTGWLYDGGLVMIGLYIVGIASAILFAFHVSAASNLDDLRLWAIILVAYDLSLVALCFDGTPFLGQSGIEFWIVNAAFFGAVQDRNRIQRLQWMPAPVSEPKLDMASIR
jgi:hypothetical protein